MGFKDISKELSEVSAQYHFHKPPAFVESWREQIGKLLRAIADFLRDFFHHSGSNVDSRSMSFLMQLGIVAAGIAAVILLAVLAYRRMIVWQRATASSTSGAVVVEELLDANGWKSQAAKLASAQDYKGACRALYLSLLQQMDECGVAKFDPARTNYEYAYSLSKYPDVQQRFKLLAEIVEFIWFGNKTAEPSDYQQSLGFVETLDSELKTIGESKRPSGPVL